MKKSVLSARLVPFALVLVTAHCGKSAADGAQRSPSPERACGPVEECATACEAGKAESCYCAGIAYEVGEGAAQDYDTAASYYERACNAGAAGGCNNLGVLYEIGLPSGADEARARPLYEQACDAGDTNGCNNLGRLR